MENIDGADMRFAKFSKHKHLNWVKREFNESLWDAMPYGYAFGTKLNMLSECKMDLTKTPFTIA